MVYDITFAEESGSLTSVLYDERFGIDGEHNYNAPIKNRNKNSVVMLDTQTVSFSTIPDIQELNIGFTSIAATVRLIETFDATHKNSSECVIKIHFDYDDITDDAVKLINKSDAFAVINHNGPGMVNDPLNDVEVLSRLRKISDMRRLIIEADITAEYPEPAPITRYFLTIFEHGAIMDFNFGDLSFDDIHDLEPLEFTDNIFYDFLDNEGCIGNQPLFLEELDATMEHLVYGCLPRNDTFFDMYNGLIYQEREVLILDRVMESSKLQDWYKFAMLKIALTSISGKVPVKITPRS